MSFDPTVNRYVSLVETCPERLANVGRDHVPEEKVSTFLGLRQQYQRLICEIGSGSGGHLLEYARQNPQSLCFGFELRYKRAFRTVEKAADRGIDNIFVFRGDARLLSTVVQPGELDTVFINFPDPWDRKRWQKHRIINIEYMETVYGLLKPEGILSYKSDHPGYFHDAFNLFQSSFIESGRYRIHRCTEDLYNSPFAEENIASEFEHLFKSKGLPVHLLELQKVGNGPSNPV